MPVIQARPDRHGRIAERPPSSVSDSMWQWNSEPMMERPTKRSPTRSWPFA